MFCLLYTSICFKHLVAKNEALAVPYAVSYTHLDVYKRQTLRFSCLLNSTDYSRYSFSQAKSKKRKDGGGGGKEEEDYYFFNNVICREKEGIRPEHIQRNKR